MKVLILYYSYTGNCKKQAMLLKTQNPEADLYEIKDKKRAGMFVTFLVNCPKAALRKKASIQEISVNLEAYDKLILVAPIWNAYPVPQFNSLVANLPENKDVELYFCSAGGESTKSKDGTCELIKNAGCRLVEYHDIKTAATHA